MGTGVGMLMFYDLKAGKYLESSINSSRTVVLKASKGFVVSYLLMILDFINVHIFLKSILSGKFKCVIDFSFTVS